MRCSITALNLRSSHARRRLLVIERFILFKVIYNLAERLANRHGAGEYDLDKNGDGYPMPQIDVTERRITTALDRIRKSIESEPVPQMANAVAHELESKVSQLQSNVQEANAELARGHTSNITNLNLTFCSQMPFAGL